MVLTDTYDMVLVWTCQGKSEPVVKHLDPVTYLIHDGVWDSCCDVVKIVWMFQYFWRRYVSVYVWFVVNKKGKQNFLFLINIQV